MKKGGTSGNCIVKKNNEFIQKNYKKSGHQAFLNELYFYLLGDELNLEYIPELIDYSVSDRMLKIKNVGTSVHELYKGKPKLKENLHPKIIKEYKKLIGLGFYHNDLRYKNVVYNEEEDQIYLIDFEFTSTKLIDKDDENILKNNNLKIGNKDKKIKKKTKKNN